MKFIVTSYSPQDKNFGSLAFFDTFKQARNFVALVSRKNAKITKKYPAMPKHIVAKVLEKAETLPSALPIVDLNWIGNFGQVVDVFRISVMK